MRNQAIRLLFFIAGALVLSLPAVAQVYYPGGRSPEQKKAAEASKAEYDKSSDTPATTVIRAAADFYLAEGYHQKYYLQQHSDLLKELKLSDTELTHSPAAAKLNSYVSGFGTAEQLAKDIEHFKFSAAAQEKLRALVSKSKRRYCA